MEKVTGLNYLEYQSLLKPLIDVIPLITFILAPDGRFYLMNRAAYEAIIESGNEPYDYHGKSGGEVFGCIHAHDDPLGCTFGPACNDCELFVLALSALKGKTAAKAPCKFYYQDRSGTKTLSLLISAGPVTILGETYAVVVIEDVSEKEKLEAELLKKMKLEALGTLAGGIAHDFNNSLMAILANIQLALLKLDKGADIKKHLLDSVEMIYNTSNLAKQLLTFSSGGAPVKTFTSITNLIKDNVNFVLQGSKIKCRFIIAPNLRPVEIDPGQISQVINNLVINAMQAMPDGGFINVIAKNVDLNSDGNYRPGRYVMIAIQDYGRGIPKENLPKIFDPFFTTKPEGTGLGLATSYSIIKKHDGYLEVDSHEGAGSLFTIYLPAALNGRTPSDNEDYPCGFPAGDTVKGPRVLVMDDEEILRNLVGEILSGFSYRITAVKDGHEAIKAYRLAKERGAPYAAVIMDALIPGSMGGQEAIIYLRAIDPDVKAIVAGDSAKNRLLKHYRKYGFRGALLKPYRFDELYGLLHKVIDDNC